MPEPVTGSGKFCWHVGPLLEPVETPALMLDLLDEARLGQPLDEIEQHDPLVVPGDDPPCFLEQSTVAETGIGRHHPVEHLVVEFQHQKMHLRHQKVLVIALVEDQRMADLIARQVVGQRRDRAAILVRRLRRMSDQHLADDLRLGGIALVEIGMDARPVAIERIEVERRCAEIHRRQRIGLLLVERRRVQRDVVVDELAEIGIARRDVHVVARGIGIARRIEPVQHRRRQFRKRIIAGRKRQKIWKHHPEFAGIAYAVEGMQRLRFHAAHAMPMHRYVCHDFPSRRSKASHLLPQAARRRNMLSS
ncbi:hypothetical protein D3C80_734970 [compost metagenome]